MKRNRKYITFLVLIIFLFGMLNGCGTNTKEDKFYDENDAIQVIDNAGRKVSFSEPVQTVATSWGGGVDMYLYALGVGDRIAATNSKHGIDKLFFDPEKMPKVGKWALDKEALAEVSPDLFLHGGYALDYLQGANQVGVRAYGMGFNSFEDIQENITNL